MSAKLTFKCPSCGAGLEYQPGQRVMACPYCGTEVDQASIAEASQQFEQDNAPQNAQQQALEAHLRTYNCTSCGAQIITDDTTAATRCYYCHSPVVLSDRLSGEFRPDGVIPFAFDKAKAEQAFDQYIRKHRFVDRRFFTPDQREMLSGVYYPYWIGDFEGEGEFVGTGTRVSTHSNSREVITTTRFFNVHRAGRLSFRNVVRRGLTKTDRLISDGIQPYDLEKTQPFAMGYLSGFLAEIRDVPEDSTQADMTQEINGYAPGLIKKGNTYNSLQGETSFRVTQSRMRYVLLPTWVLTYKGGRDGVPFFFMMNGQTGKTCGKLPVSRGRLAAWCVGIAAAVIAVFCAGGAMLW